MSVSVDPSDKPITVDRVIVERAIVTRAESSDGPLSSELRALGIPVLLWPAVKVTPADTGPLQAALDRLTEFDWIVFASRHAVAAVTERVSTAPQGIRVAAIGHATAQVLRQRGWPVDLLPEDFNAGALVSAFATLPAQESGLAGSRVLYPASSRALPTLAAGLSQLGAQVHQVEAYRTESAPLDVAECRTWIEGDAIGAVTFSSPSAVIELEQTLGKDNFDRLLSKAAAIAIGQTTAQELTERGHTCALADSATLRGLALTTSRVLESRQRVSNGESR